MPAFAAALAAFALLSACSREQVAEPYQPADSHQRYSEALRTLGIGDTAVAESWFRSGREALDNPTPILPPATETVYFDPHEADAVAYEFPVPRGQRVVIELDTAVSRYFADVYRVAQELQGEALESPVHVASAGPEGRLEFVPQRGGRYLLRVQPEILRGGRFDIQIDTNASLAWPVPGTDENAVWSVFGDGRDGGARAHHGLDIFAPHGNPVVAVSESRVRSVGRRDRGGKVITLRDEELGINIYYAHLSAQLTERGSRVAAGDEIGLIGNSGNAQATPAHLHIGIYDGSWGSPVDPWYFFVDSAADPPEPGKARETLGRWVRTVPGGVQAVTHPPGEWGTKPSPAGFDGRGNRLPPEARPQTRMPAGERVALPGRVPVRELGRLNGFVRIRTAEGAMLHVPETSLEELTEPVAALSAASARAKRQRPSATAAVIGQVEPGTQIELLGYIGSYAMAREAGGTQLFFLWLPAGIPTPT